MSVSIGAVAAALLTIGNAPSEAPGGAATAKLLGVILMPVAICFALFSGWVFTYRRGLLTNDDLFNPHMHSTKVPMLLGYILCAALCSIFILDVMGHGIRL